MCILSNSLGGCKSYRGVRLKVLILLSEGPSTYKNKPLPKNVWLEKTLEMGFCPARLARSAASEL